MGNDFQDDGDPEEDVLEDNDNLEEERVNSPAIEQYLKGLNYPADKQDLLDRACENKAPSDILYILSLFENRMYESPVDITKELSNIHT